MADADSPSSGAPPPKAPKALSSEELDALVREQLAPNLTADAGIYIADKSYHCPSLDEAIEIIIAGGVSEYRKFPSKFDCDDFALLLKARFAEAAYRNSALQLPYCFGILWGRRIPYHHAMNWFVGDDLQLRFVEPSNNRVFLPRERHRDIYLMLA